MIRSYLDRSVKRETTHDLVKWNMVDFCSVPRGKEGRPSKALTPVSTVTHTRAILRRAFRDVVLVHEYISSSPVEKAERPRANIDKPGTIWTAAQLRTFLSPAR
ncbi:hypothetical protein [Nonomuraea sp. NPDC005501]|uniref:hypothetical protein n=1 Tax=Nonomuraea sp. NPDC005501 TaxID=3156884 RepID=UPI0033B7C0DE